MRARTYKISPEYPNMPSKCVYLEGKSLHNMFHQYKFLTHCTSLFHLLGAGGRPPIPAPLDDPGREFEPSDGTGAGLMGRLIMFWLELLEVRAGYAGRGGAGADEPFCACCLRSAEPLLSGFACSWSFSLIPAAGAAGARCDLRLLCSSMLTAQASRSTGVRLAA